MFSDFHPGGDCKTRRFVNSPRRYLLHQEGTGWKRTPLINPLMVVNRLRYDFTFRGTSYCNRTYRWIGEGQ